MFLLTEFVVKYVHSLVKITLAKRFFSYNLVYVIIYIYIFFNNSFQRSSRTSRTHITHSSRKTTTSSHSSHRKISSSHGGDRSQRRPGGSLSRTSHYNSSSASTRVTASSNKTSSKSAGRPKNSSRYQGGGGGGGSARTTAHTSSRKVNRRRREKVKTTDDNNKNPQKSFESSIPNELKKPRQCFGPGCTRPAARPDTKYCSNECGRKLAIKLAYYLPACRLGEAYNISYSMRGLGYCVNSDAESSRAALGVTLPIVFGDQDRFILHSSLLNTLSCNLRMFGLQFSPTKYKMMLQDWTTLTPSLEIGSDRFTYLGSCINQRQRVDL
ncbi:unnamed protein product [Trichobilharzia regenti]|nr:unnamed protein product [Trichobilharzia regenti]